MDHSLEILANTVVVIIETSGHLQFTLHHPKTMLLSLTHPEAGVMAIGTVCCDTGGGGICWLM